MFWTNQKQELELPVLGVHFFAAKDTDRKRYCWVIYERHEAIKLISTDGADVFQTSTRELAELFVKYFDETRSLQLEKP